MIMSLDDIQCIVGDILSGDIPGIAGTIRFPERLHPANSDSFSLANGIKTEPDMLSDYLAVRCFDRPGFIRQIAVQKGTERTFANKAYSG